MKRNIKVLVDIDTELSEEEARQALMVGVQTLDLENVRVEGVWADTESTASLVEMLHRTKSN